jgi:hypothetical protein
MSFLSRCLLPSRAPFLGLTRDIFGAHLSLEGLQPKYFLIRRKGHDLASAMKKPFFDLWKNLKLNPARKGGRRKGGLPFYLSEYVWQTSRRHLRPEQQIDNLLKLLFDLQSQRPKLHAHSATHLP